MTDHEVGADVTEGQAFANQAFTSMWDMYFKPEIERREAAGEIKDGFHLYMAQALFPPEGEARILLNEEVEGVALMRAPRVVEKGDPVFVADMQHVERFDLPDELLDNGYFTVIRAGAGWNMYFNFLSGRAKAKDVLELAAEFLEAARHSCRLGNAGPSVDNLYSAAELVSKAELILHRSRAVKSKKHSLIASEINAWAKLGNIDAAFVALFNKLAQQRPNARYGDKPHRPAAPDEDSLDLVAAMIDRGMANIAKATALPKEG